MPQKENELDWDRWRQYMKEHGYTDGQIDAMEAESAAFAKDAIEKLQAAYPWWPIKAKRVGRSGGQQAKS